MRFRQNSHRNEDCVNGLEKEIAPIMPIQRMYRMRNRDGNICAVTRTQMPLQAAYSLTDYKSQGQTIKHVIVDIGKPPTGTISPFNAYVALSRSKGRDGIRVLRDFEEKLLQSPPSEALIKEDNRLERLARVTEQEIITYQDMSK